MGSGTAKAASGGGWREVQEFRRQRLNLRRECLCLYTGSGALRSGTASVMTGYEALRKSAAWIDLSARGKIRVTGEDRVRLLHAMCTNDVKNLAPWSGLYAFFLDSRGRILVDATIYNHG